MRSLTTCLAPAKAASVASLLPNISWKATLPLGLSSHTFGAPKVWDDNPNGNVAFQLMFGNKEATDAAFAGAKHVVKLRMENNRLTPVSMEPRNAIGDYNAAEDAYTLYTSSQNPHGARTEISHIFHVAENQVRVVSPDVGGGFGLKGGAFPDDALVLWASR